MQPIRGSGIPSNTSVDNQDNGPSAQIHRPRSDPHSASTHNGHLPLAQSAPDASVNSHSKSLCEIHILKPHTGQSEKIVMTKLEGSSSFNGGCFQQTFTFHPNLSQQCKANNKNRKRKKTYEDG